jgi:hypothetical protein
MLQIAFSLLMLCAAAVLARSMLCGGAPVSPVFVLLVYAELHVCLLPCSSRCCAQLRACPVRHLFLHFPFKL